MTASFNRLPFWFEKMMMMMNPARFKHPYLLATAAALLLGMLSASPAAHAADDRGSTTHATSATQTDDSTLRQVIAEKLPNVPGKSLTAVVVNYAPGGTSSAHHHAGSVFAYVLSGAIRSQVSDQGPARVYHAGESFFEPPGSEHMVSENASATKPASLLAVFVANTDATLTTFGTNAAGKH